MKNFTHLLFVLLTVLVLKTYSQDVGWEMVNSNTTENLNSIYFYDYENGFACGDSGTVLRSIDSGKTWQLIPNPVSVNLNDCFMFSELCFRAVGDSASWLGTSDGGNTWSFDYILAMVNDIYSLSFSPREQFMYDGIYGADSQKIMFGSSTLCSDIVNDVHTNGPGGFWSAHMLTNKIGFVAGENSFSQPILGRTTNSGSTWDYVSFYLDGNEGRATGVIFTDQLTGFISALVWDGRGAIAKTSDNGNNWTTTFFNNPLWDINFPLSDASQLGYCVGDSGTIFKTFNAGESWHKQFTNTSERLNKVFFLDSDFGFAVGDNGIILRTTDGGGITSVIEDEILGTTNFELFQNYPNPFNPTTKIKYSIPSNVKRETSNMSLKVYDVLGNEVAALVKEDKSAGEYEVEFSATGGGKKLTSGIYFYQLKSGKFIQTKKMILIR